MTKNRYAGVIGGFLLALAASATWDFGLKPIASGIGEAIILLSTLGITSFIDGMYLQVGFAQPDRVSLMIQGFLISGLLGFLIGVALFSPKFGILSGRQKIDGAAVTKIAISKIFGMIYIAFTCTFLSVEQAKAFYISGCMTTLSMIQDQIAPYIEENQRIKFKAQARSIQTRADYRKFTDDLKAVAITNGLTVPDLLII
jgi:hypothetical protein